MSVNMSHLRKYMFLAFILISATCFITGCQKKKEPAPITKSAFMLNTVIQVTLYDENEEHLIEEVFDLCKLYEEQYSRTIPTSKISEMNNRDHDTQTFELDDDLEELLQKALYYSEISDGRFDLTMEPVTSLWDFVVDPFVVPDEDIIKEKLSYVDYRNIIIKDHQITFLSPETRLDLGAIAKGFIADKMKAFLVSQGVTSGVINLGGNVLCIGDKPDGTLYKIGVQKPFEDREETVETLAISDATVVSSGVYERNRIVNGINFHHLLDSATGFPVNNDLTSVTIITGQSVDGDALSTTCFVLGLDEGMTLINTLQDTYAIFITTDGALHYSDGALDLLTE